MKLIIINGSPASGKSTLSKKLHKEINMSLLADVDTWRKLISNWESNRVETLSDTYKFTIAAVNAYLETGKSVIVDKAILSDNNVIDELISCGNKHKTDIFEFILNADEETIIQRAKKRSLENKSFLHVQSIIELWNVTQKLIKDRPCALVVNTSKLDPEEVFEKIKSIIFDGI